MNKAILLLLAALLGFSPFAQQKNDVTYSIEMGFFLCPTYENADAGDIAFAEVGFSISNK